MKTKGKIAFYLLIPVIAAYVIKNLFVGADIDEGYGIVMGYRLASGDRLLLEMWEPHQTSAIFTAVFINPFLWLTGGNTDFLNLYLRVVYFAGQGLIASLLYHTIYQCVPSFSKENAMWLALVFFVSSPKSIFVPEYSNLQIWFSALLCLCFMWYYCEKSPRQGKYLLLAAGGLCLTWDVLAYPSMVLLLPFCLLFIWRKHRKHFARECVAFLAPCVLCVLCFLGYLLTYMTFSQISEVLPYVLDDGSHSADLASRLSSGVQNLLQIVEVLALALIMALLLAWVREQRNKKKSRQGSFLEDTLMLFFVFQICYQVGYWLWGGDNAAQPHVIYLALVLVGIYCCYKDGWQEKTGFYLILLSLIGYVGVCLMSNWGPMFLCSYLIMGAVGGLMCWNVYWEKHAVYLKNTLLRILCAVLVLSNVFGFCWLIIGGEQNHSNILEVRGIFRDGFRKGIFSSYMNAYRYNTNVEQWAELVPDGSTVLYVGPSQFFYMLGDCTIASPNTISTPSYDENLLAYWEINPDRYPDVVVLESWFGDIRVAEEDDFIIQWLKNSFGATEVIEDSYVTVYRK